MKTRTIDTNILVRLLAQDNDEQWAAAADLVSRFQLVIISTVILETEWVLRSRYDFNRQRILALFNAALDMQTFIFVERQRVIQTLEAFSRGLDFADAFHLSALLPGETFITFDRDLVRLANKHIGGASVELIS